MWYVHDPENLAMQVSSPTIQFTRLILIELKICIGIHTGFDDPVVELPNLALRQNVYGPHESDILASRRFQHY